MMPGGPGGELNCDAVVIGGGIAGVSAAYWLSRRGADVVVLEREDTLAAHSTGRSAAQFIPTYGGPVNLTLSIHSRDFLLSGAGGLADSALLAHRPVLWVAEVGRLGQLEHHHRLDPGALERLEPTRTVEHCPVLRTGWVAGGLLEQESHDIDVAALHQAFLRGARRYGARVLRGDGVRALRRTAGRWLVTADSGGYAAPLVVNAAGAWADEVARMAGVAPLGLRALRRTIFTFLAPKGHRAEQVRTWPLVVDMTGRFYFKPEGPGGLLGSPSDETPVPPGDARPDELDVARGIEALNLATTLGVRSVQRVWAGLRTFAPDRHPVLGLDETDGFLWCAGQGGTGIQTSPAMGELAASLACDAAPPEPLADLAPQLSPRRFRRGT